MVRAGPAAEETVVVLPRGAGLAQITTALLDAGVIDHPWLFRLAVRVLGRDRDLKAGEYAFPARATPQGVIAMLAKGETVARRLTVAEGLTVSEIFELLQSAEGLVGELPPPPEEGSLLPETYFYAYGDSRVGLVRRMEEAMRATLEDLWSRRAEDLPFRTRQEALILASIVDKETGVADERDKVAAVFINRLRLGMRLQADPTVIYGLTEGDGALGRELNRATGSTTAPTTPTRSMACPRGRSAIQAGLRSRRCCGRPDVDYLYFVADGSGGHAFARTLAEHNRNVAQWRKIKNGERPPPVTPAPAKPGTAG